MSVGGPRGWAARTKGAGTATVCQNTGKPSSPALAKWCTWAVKGGAARSAWSRQKAQAWCCDEESSSPGLLAGVPKDTLRGPVLVQISSHGEASPRAATSACDTVGASAANTASNTASHATQERCSKVVRSARDISRGQSVVKSI